MSAGPLACALPHAAGESVLLAHGEGARLTRRLIREVLLARLGNEFLAPLADGAVLPPVDGRVAVTTDSFVVSPLFFPGGDIGRLAVNGTVNDLAVCGAEPLYLTLALILEEGLPFATLDRVVASLADAATACGVRVVTGDTKVVPRGAADGLFVNTTGVGRVRAGLDLGAHRIAPGDAVVVSGTLGDHGLAVLAAREALGLESGLTSDCAPIHPLVTALLDGGVPVRFMRDPTRGGLAAVLHELAEASGFSLTLDERAVPLSEPVRGAAELLGLDPLYVANEGKLVAVVPAEHAARAVALLRAHPRGRAAAVVGQVGADRTGQVLVRGGLGALRVLDEPTGAPLPRIC
jgi:hydrogenase expression/formation protein HypE